MDTFLEINNRSRIFGTRSVTRLEEELVEGVEEGGELLVLLLRLKEDIIISGVIDVTDTETS